MGSIHWGSLLGSWKCFKDELCLKLPKSIIYVALSLLSVKFDSLFDLLYPLGMNMSQYLKPPHCLLPWSYVFLLTLISSPLPIEVTPKIEQIWKLLDLKTLEIADATWSKMSNPKCWHKQWNNGEEEERNWGKETMS